MSPLLFSAFPLHSFHMIFYFSSPSSVCLLEKVLILWLLSSRRQSNIYSRSFPHLILLKGNKAFSQHLRDHRMQVKARPAWRLLWDIHCHSLYHSFIGQLRCLFHLSNAIIVVKLAIHQTANFAFIFKREAIPAIIIILNRVIHLMPQFNS